MGTSARRKSGRDLTGNHLLDSLSAAERSRLQGRLTPVALRVKTVLVEPGRPIPAVYFPVNGVVSLVTPLSDGALVEVATIGNEGIIGVPRAFGQTIATVRAITQVSGAALKMTVAAFLEETSRGTELGAIVDDYPRCSVRSRRLPAATGCTTTRRGSAAGC